VGETIVFELSVVNTGDVPLVTLPLDDTFDPSVLSYQSATPPADSVGAGTLTWNDIGPLPVGAETSVVVSLTALASTVGSTETNVVVASPTTPPDLPPVPPQTNDVPYDISNPGYLLTKTLISPLGRAAAVGESILFNLTVENTGDVALVTVPLVDTFLPAFLTYEGAQPPADSVIPGTLTWNDIGPLPVGASTSVVVSLLATDSTGGFSETNIVVASPTTPPDQPPVPPQTNDVPYEISNPGYSLLKTLNSPTGRSAEVGETIEFTLTLVNTGDVTLVTVPLDDTYDPSFLSFLSAVPPPDSSAPGSLSWLNLGPLPSGVSTSVVVSFTAIASSQSESQTNTVVATPTTPPDQPPVPPRTNEVPYEISNPGYALTKTLLSPTGRSAQVGETLVFSLNVVNTGDVVLVTVPLVDTFDPAFLSFSSSVPPADSAGAGSLTWNDIGPLPVGVSTSVQVSFTAVASSQSESQTNTVVATPTTPPDEPPVPPRTNEVPYQISSPGFALSKAVVSPSGRAAEIGETLVFTLTVSNTGDVDLVTVPVDDIFNPAVLSYQSAVPPADTVGVGTLAWRMSDRFRSGRARF
jgi:uncharacterized repeat protein (TIGR01451 family)